MNINREKKEQTVEKLREVSNKAVALIAVDYHGLSANDMNALRSKAREEDSTVYIVKNTLARRALQDTPYACVVDQLSGPMALIFANNEAPSAARLVKEFADKNENLEAKIVALSGELRDISEIKKLASLPTREQALAILLAVMKEPIAKLARVLVAPHSKLVRTVDAVRAQKQETE